MCKVASLESYWVRDGVLESGGSEVVAERLIPYFAKVQPDWMSWLSLADRAGVP